MSDYIRDKKTGALLFNNPEKEKDILEKRSIRSQIKALTEEINTIKKQVTELLAERN